MQFVNGNTIEARPEESPTAVETKSNPLKRKRTDPKTQDKLMRSDFESFGAHADGQF
jgi:hypothetical protein